MNSKPKQAEEIPNELGKVEENVNRLDDIITALLPALESVLVAEPSVDSESKVAVVCESPLGKRLQDISIKITRMNDFVAELLARLAI